MRIVVQVHDLLTFFVYVMVVQSILRLVESFFMMVSGRFCAMIHLCAGCLRPATSLFGVHATLVKSSLCFAISKVESLALIWSASTLLGIYPRL